MRYIFNFPDIGEGLDEGIIAEWHVTKGQQVKSGDPLVLMETDKVVTDIPSPKSGTIVATYGKVGETIHVGSPLVEIEIEGVVGEEAVAEATKKDFVEPSEEPIEEGSFGVVGTIEVAGNKAFLPASEEGVAETPSAEKPQKKALATPVARAMAKEFNVDINSIKGTGPGGRITKEDIHKYVNGAGKPTVQRTEVAHVEDQVTYEPLTQIRKTIAKTMSLSKQNAVHMTVHEEVEISELMRVREKYKVVLAERNIKLTYLAFIVKATALALKQHPALNAQLDLDNNRMVYKHYFNIGIAVDTHEGLVVPVIRNADKLSIAEIAAQISALSEKAKERKLTLDDMKDGTFTITNYGAIGGIFANPVINYPQSGILGVGRLLKKPIVKGDQIAIGNILPLSLAVDHRIVDGGETTRFLLRIMRYLEDPIAMEFE
ncbi:dihydrolipoamide acetyltransferase family protein [Acetobacteroides hydrogenigenes]|uniref:Dihydrolipoamide acetyltransferase component of pyruvate dehydrogenase complex n=1 Tax=Acetobacteroides hydrogenigenes TaxID=979970 RepID=A0A4R2ERV6_9BACT|nr:dihydrolipoamide acetyltransferase family protein [Acetobacteroides hydrogenigenes]TCN70162.1 pyruvate dehydrogenase E2 component (dihydrolipoamide acetyltransferase) [Acetobacteroides hydrogenigenes]